MLRKYGLMVVLVMLLLAPPLQPGTKELRELQALQTEVVQLQTKVIDLQKKLDANAKLMNDLLTQIKDDVGTTSAAVTGLRKQMQTQEKQGEGLASDLGRQLRGISEKLDGTDQRLSTLAERVSELRLKTADANPNVPGRESAPAADELYNASYKDFLSGNYEMSLEGFQKFLRYYSKTERGAEAQYYVGESFYGLKRYGDAIKAFDELAGTYPGAQANAPAQFKSGLAFMEMNDRPAAIARFQTVVTKYPETPEANLARKRLELLGASVRPATPTKPKAAGARRPQ